ncbi:hypothetical protein CspeluHIS016_0103200 [Cutaneotrichosporon spelunceum]|uniref:Trehalase n=1 Tax=Cutaneotrichosporon spelunceum TaxID=1672016 RepID=A0AAD3TNK2_9TREE|nr:hypothetical protein CspeluHIS016_0103200 [Cutaneotrichosporon spelunceum]
MFITYLLLGQAAAQSVAEGPQAPPQVSSPTFTAPIQKLPTSLSLPASFPGTASLPLGGGGTQTAVSTAVPSVSGSPDTPVPGQDTIPPLQWWCADNATYCPGRLLQDVQLARVFPDSKTFVDKPTNGSLNDTLNAFDKLGTNVTVGQISTFASDYFKGEGQELMPVEIEGFNPNPAILSNVTDPIYRAWVAVVHGYWTLLIRATNESALCQPGPTGCSSSLIPLNHTIVVPGGRYREIYYWDSYWILQGLLASELNNYAWNLLQNFMDLLDTVGFIPNGGRKYYLNRSQMPVFTQMVHAYVTQTGNTTVLDRALPLLDAELLWWETNRTMNVTSPFSQKTHQVAHFAVNNSAPRPEGFVEDYGAAFGTPENPQNFTEQQRSDLYAELASGAESGWDYSSRWCREPLLNETDNNVVLRTLNIRRIIPVDLTALLASNHYLVAELYEMHASGGNGTAGPGGPVTVPTSGALGPTTVLGTATPSPPTLPAESPSPVESPPAQSPPAGSPVTTQSTPAESPAKRTAVPTLPLPGGATTPAPSLSLPPVPSSINGTTGTGGNNGGAGESPATKAAAHRAKADAYKAAVLDLHWDAERAYFYDYNVSANAHSPVYSPGGLWPLWLNITPDGLEGNEEMALKIASGQRFLLGKYAGAPSVASLLKTGLNWDFPNVWPPHVYTTIKAFETLHRLVPNASTVATIDIPFDQVAPNQFNLDEAALPEQPPSTIGNTSLFTNGSEPWPKQMAIEIAHRYMTDAFCSWYSTGGMIPGVLQQLPISDLNATGTWTPDQAGHMFEKFNVTDPDAAGGGGEYSTQIGFGWTNGAVLWTAGRYGQFLPAPTCPLIPIVANGNTGNGTAGNGPTGNSTAGGTNTTAGAGMSGTRAMFRGYRIPRK